MQNPCLPYGSLEFCNKGPLHDWPQEAPRTPRLKGTSLTDTASHALSHSLPTGLRAPSVTPRGGGLDSCTWFPPAPLADFALYPFTEISHSREYDTWWLLQALPVRLQGWGGLRDPWPRPFAPCLSVKLESPSTHPDQKMMCWEYRCLVASVSYIFLFLIFIFILFYLAVLDPSCSMQDLQSLLKHANS